MVKITRRVVDEKSVDYHFDTRHQGEALCSLLASQSIRHWAGWVKGRVATQYTVRVFGLPRSAVEDLLNTTFAWMVQPAE